MPQDTIWTGHGENFIVVESQISSTSNRQTLDFLAKSLNEQGGIDYRYDQRNSPHSDSLFRYIVFSVDRQKKTAYDTDKAYYDGLGTYIITAILFGAFYLYYYAYKRLKRKRENIFEDESDWVEIGTNNPEASLYDLGRRVNVQKLPKRTEYLTYHGKDFNFTQQQITDVLIKRFPYYNNLSTEKKNLFLNRHKKFLKTKVFRIHDKTGFKEMPILISATAIQLSLGLNEYLLPNYKNIHIFPSEFLGLEPTLRFLEGNVSGNSINISWKHYLQGYENNENGQNVGLHEMAHAYYCQNMVCADERDFKFVKGYSNFDLLSNTVFNNEILATQKLYTDYGLKNLQEFWAESVEIFFERPSAMNQQYPDLYNSMSLLLNQSPV